MLNRLLLENICQEISILSGSIPFKRICNSSPSSLEALIMPCNDTESDNQQSEIKQPLD